MALPETYTRGQRLWHWAHWGIALGVLAFLVLPVLVILPLSFSAGSFLTFPLPGLSLRWYQEFFTSAPWRLSLRNSLIVASATTLIATTLGTLAALGLSRARLPGQALLMGLIVSPMVVPLVIVAVGVYFAYAPFGLTGSLVGLTLAHTALAVPFVVITVTATLTGFDTSLMRASASLGAPPLVAFRRVALPIIFPGVFSGAVFAFATSFDEVIVTTFTAGQQETLPIWIFSQLTRPRDRPVTNVVATFVILITFLPILLAQRISAQSADTEGENK